MDESETYMNVKFTKTDSQFPSRDGLNSTYSLLKLGKTELRIDEDEDAPIALGPAELSVAAQAGPHKQEPNGNIGNRPDRKTCLLCLVTFVLVAIVVGLSMHEQASSQDWIRNKGGCYFISTFHISYDEAKQYCSKSDSKLIEINSAEEEKFVDKAVRDQGTSYWIGKCKDGKVSSNVVYRMYGGDPECGVCSYDFENKACSQVRYRFICEKSAALCPDISEKLQDLCQQPVGPS
ncbi:oxidized low-density lipoprotein receptor 1-like isoform X2 [Hemitrygon akajei]|uniref:oxidized low-density lipoprotein receptor 1-like isoform X2 n=1 Tax=Hemitrygon akajei TaxID=2704970 RepID=UPI003BF9A814